MRRTYLAYFTARLVNGLIALSSIYVLTRLLPAEEYGKFALGISCISVVASILFQWINVGVARFYSAHLDAPERLLREAYRLFFMVGITALPVAFVVGWLQDLVSVLFCIGIGIGVIGMGLHSLGLQIANAAGRLMRYALLSTSRGVFALISAVILIHAGFGAGGAVLGAALATLASAMVGGVFSAFWLTEREQRLKGQLVKYGLPLTLTYLSTTVLDASDRFLIAWWMGPAAVTGYAVSYDLAQQTVGAALNVLFLANYPRITAAWERGGAPMAWIAMIPLSHAMLVAVPLIVGVFVGLAPDIAAFFLNPDSSGDAAKVMPWVAIAVGISCFKGFYLDIAFQLAKVTHMQLRITMLMASLNVLLNLVMIPRFGVQGAAISITIAVSFGALLSWLFGRRYRIYPMRPLELLGALLACFALVLGIKEAPVSGEHGAAWIAGVRLGSGLLLYLAAVFILDVSRVRTCCLKRVKAAQVKWL